MSSTHLFYKTRQRQFKKRTLQTSHPHEHRHKNPQQNARRSNPAMLCRKNSTSQSLWFVPGTKGWFSFPKSGDRIHHANSLKGKKHLIMLVHAEKKPFDKISAFIHDKSCQANLEKGICQKSTANILGGERILSP